MDLRLTTDSWTVEDRSWLGSRDGTAFTQTVTLYVPAFTANTHYPLGYIPSGIILAKITSGSGVGLYGPYAGATAEVQTVTITGTPTGGTFTLTFQGETTAAIAYNATASAVEAALEALSVINAGDVAVTGGPGPGTAYTVTFGGQYHGENVAQMTTSGASLTGGSTPASAVTTGTGGGSSATNGLETPEGFLWNSLEVKNSPTNLGAPILWRGVIKASRLPAASGLDANARVALAAKFRFQ
jgi:hypothetical protein